MNKFKDFVGNKKIILGLLTLALILAIVCVSSFIPFIIDPSRFMTTQFLTDELLIIVITIATTIAVMFIAQASNADNPKSELCRARVEFARSLEEITDLTRFYQWIKKVLRLRDKEDIIERELLAIGVTKDVYNLNDTELKELTKNAQKYGEKFYKRITEEQEKEIKRLKIKVAKLQFVSPNYYTTCKNIEPQKTNSERASSETKKKILYVMINLSTKIILTLIFGMIIASLVKDATQELNVEQAWLTFLSRIFAFISSSFLGWIVGSKLNDIDAFYILNRVEAHKLYKEDKDFQAVDEGKEEYIERIKKEQLIPQIEQKQD